MLKIFESVLKIFAVYENIIEMDFKHFCPIVVTKETTLILELRRERMIISSICSTEFHENSFIYLLGY